MSNQLSITTPKLKVVFSKSSANTDRWSNQISLIDGDQQTILLTSVEGDDQQTWPASPPLQDISHHDLPGGEAILGVGMAGKSHWSASVSVQENDALFFDMACLIKSPDAVVGSQYAVGDGVEIETADDKVYLKFGNTKIAIEPLLKDTQQTILCSDSATVTMQPAADLAGVTGSIRWCFHMRLDAA